jgi:GNAT superfamily N-acetyltransferase
MPHPKIRVGTPADAVHIAPLFREVQQLHADHVPARFNDTAEIAGEVEWLCEVFAGAQSYLLVAEDDGIVVGYLGAQDVVREPSLIRPALRYFMLEHIAVSKSSRRQGIGSALINALFAEAKVRGIHRIELEVWSFNEPSQQFFARHGFQPFSQRMGAVVPET